jgi:hypothetical protein
MYTLLLNLSLCSTQEKDILILFSAIFLRFFFYHSLLRIVVNMHLVWRNEWMNELEDWHKNTVRNATTWSTKQAQRTVPEITSTNIYFKTPLIWRVLSSLTTSFMFLVVFSVGHVLMQNRQLVLNKVVDYVSKRSFIHLFFNPVSHSPFMVCSRRPLFLCKFCSSQKLSQKEWNQTAQNISTLLAKSTRLMVSQPIW